MTGQQFVEHLNDLNCYFRFFGGNPYQLDEDKVLEILDEAMLELAQSNGWMKNQFTSSNCH
jgi:hypothetical protein